MHITVNRRIELAEPGFRVKFSTALNPLLLELKPVPFTRQHDVLKRMLDAAVAAFSLILFSVPMLLIALLIKLTSPGPALYRAPRVGRGGRHFIFYKFRSMYADQGGRAAVGALNEKQGHIFKVARDPRVTPIGRWLRRYSLDELPQLFNILRGDMSLVGPRPLPAEDLDPDGQSRQFAAWAEQRSRVLPGLTGWWQVRGRSDLSFESMVELDLYYIRNWSLALDLKILLLTPLAALSGRGAY
jgi:lipopolysaccharide/colanic/teichoic acid biosynthesis glycosyltransferase